MIDLDELLEIARHNIHVDVSSLEFLRLDNPSERWSQSIETAPP
jgi:hypothetical protein